MAIKYWDGKGPETLEPGMVLLVKHDVEKKGKCWHCDHTTQEEGWFVASFVGQDDTGNYVFRIYETEDVGMPPVIYDSYCSTVFERCCKPTNKFNIVEDEPK